MTINNHESKFFNKPIVDYKPGEAVDVAHNVYRIGFEYDDEGQPLEALLDAFLQQVDKSRLDALVIGLWNQAYESSVQSLLDHLVSRCAELPALRALFIGDITYEQCEISWIIQGSYKALLDAFPKLEVLRIRGGTQLEIEPFEHHGLRQLIIESGGLSAIVLNSLSASQMPALESLELWLGTEGYGFDGDIYTVDTLLQAIDPSRLRYLGLRDSDIADALAQHLAQQPWLAKLETLDLSLGTLGDAGAKALIDSPYVRQLKRLDISHHYLSDEVLARIEDLPIEVIAEDRQEDDDGDRYVAVGE